MDKKIDTDGDIAVLCKNWRWEWHSKERGGVSGCCGARCLPLLEGGYIRTVDGKGAVCIIRSDRAVENKVVLEDVTESFLVRASKHAIEFASKVGLLDLTLGELALVFCYSVKESVVGNINVRVFTVVNVKTRGVLGKTQKGAVFAVDVDGRGLGGVHGDGANSYPNPNCTTLCTFCQGWSNCQSC